VNFALSDEQQFLQDAARGALARVKTVEAAREALDGAPLPDLWPTAVEAGWPGLLVSEERGGAGLGAIEAMLVFAELGRVLASVPLLGHLPATLLHADESLADGTRRAAFVAADPADWTTDPREGLRRAPAPVFEDGTLTGEVAWVPDAPGADVLVVVCAEGRVAVTEGGDVEPVRRYDATRSLGHVRFDGTSATEVDADPAAAAWHLAQALIAAESLGAVEVALETAVAYAKERHTFGRAIGSYQAVKHELVEILRRLENARSLMFYAGWAWQDRPGELALAAAAFRTAAGGAVDHATRALISVHGGIGATWEHDAPLYFRRAQLSRRLLGGSAGASRQVADELFREALAAA
jgi:alkylation response protein AidB-like acyl-CoA dehydrogenase